tara:strand:+ start:7398 stop:8069 length:672 start_codon:yes stop_codon:yes gene_type:complete
MRNLGPDYRRNNWNWGVLKHFKFTGIALMLVALYALLNPNPTPTNQKIRRSSKQNPSYMEPDKRGHISQSDNYSLDKEVDPIKTSLGLEYDVHGRVIIDAKRLIPIDYGKLGVCRDMEVFRVTDYVLWQENIDKNPASFSSRNLPNRLHTISISDFIDNGYAHDTPGLTFDHVTLNGPEFGTGGRTLKINDVSRDSIPSLNLKFKENQPIYTEQEREPGPQSI